jgi:hypothetical protein
MEREAFYVPHNMDHGAIPPRDSRPHCRLGRHGEAITQLTTGGVYGGHTGLPSSFLKVQKKNYYCICPKPNRPAGRTRHVVCTRILSVRAPVPLTSSQMSPAIHTIKFVRFSYDPTCGNESSRARQLVANSVWVWAGLRLWLAPPLNIIFSFYFGTIGYLPKSSSPLDHLTKVHCTLVNYPGRT